MLRRRRRNKFGEVVTRKPFGEHDQQAIKDAIDQMFQKVVQNLAPAPSIKHEDILNLFAPEHHRDILREAPKVARTNRYQRDDTLSVGWPLSACANVALHFRLLGADVPFVPALPKLQPDAPQEIVDALSNWLRERWEIGRDWSRVKQVFTMLNDACNTPQQVRYLWPSILTLAKEAQLDKAEKIQEYTQPTNLPVIDPNLRMATRTTLRTIATATLMPDPVKREYAVMITPVQLGSVTEDGLGTFAVM